MLDRFELEHELGAGTRGIVYRGRDRTTGRRVAIKLVPGGPAPGGPGEAPHSRVAEPDLQPLLDLRHPDIAAVYEVGCRGHLRYVVMELAGGRDLGAHTDLTTLLPLSVVLRLTARAALALQHAHARGLAHGDVKPGNIVFDSATDTLKLTDFGLDGPHAAATPAYCAPERLCGAPPAALADQFSLGAALYQLACGMLPFAGRTRAEAAEATLGAPTPDIRRHRPGLPHALSAVIDRALAKAPGARFPSAEAFAAALDAVAAPAEAERA